MRCFVSVLGSLTIIFTSFVMIGAQTASPVPSGATVLEKAAIGRSRKLILWMLHPTKHPNEYTKDDFYTCPDETRGSYYSGELHVSLVDSRTAKVVNTIIVRGNEDDGQDTEIDIPYKIRGGGPYYKVINGSKYVERKPKILFLRDYNGDGKPQEFALFDAEACMGLGTTIIGYSEKEDRVKQYPILVRTSEGTATQYWLDYLFSKRPIRAGFWKYQIDYRGRAGTLDKFTVRYDRRAERFDATIKSEQ